MRDPVPSLESEKRGVTSILRIGYTKNVLAVWPGSCIFAPTRGCTQRQSSSPALATANAESPEAVLQPPASGLLLCRTPVNRSATTFGGKGPQGSWILGSSSGLIAAYHPERVMVHPIPQGRAIFRKGRNGSTNLTQDRQKRRHLIQTLPKESGLSDSEQFVILCRAFTFSRR